MTVSWFQRQSAVGGSLEGELDRVEAEVGAQRARVSDAVRVLEALATGLEATVESRDITQIEAALELARELSSTVRQRVQEAMATESP